VRKKNTIYKLQKIKKIKSFSNFFHANYDNLQQKKSLLTSASIFDMPIIQTMQRVRELETLEL
jgi:hypothetical protein